MENIITESQLKKSIISFLESNILFKYANIENDIEYDYEKNKAMVNEEVKYHIGNNQVSSDFVDQLTELHGRNYVTINNQKHPYNVIDIYWRLEDIINKTELPKVFNR